PSWLTSQSTNSTTRLPDYQITRFLTGFLDECYRLVLREPHPPGDGDLTDFLLVGHLIHQAEHQVFDDHAQPARADLALERRPGVRSVCRGRRTRRHR